MFPFSVFVPYHGNFCSMTLVSLKTAYSIKWPSLDIHIAVFPPKISSAKNIESWILANNIVKVHPKGLVWSVALLPQKRTLQNILKYFVRSYELSGAYWQKSSENSRQNKAIQQWNGIKLIRTLFVPLFFDIMAWPIITLSCKLNIRHWKLLRGKFAENKAQWPACMTNECVEFSGWLVK